MSIISPPMIGNLKNPQKKKLKHESLVVGKSYKSWSKIITQAIRHWYDTCRCNRHHLETMNSRDNNSMRSFFFVGEIKTFKLDARFEILIDWLYVPCGHEWVSVRVSGIKGTLISDGQLLKIEKEWHNDWSNLTTTTTKILLLTYSNKTKNKDRRKS